MVKVELKKRTGDESSVDSIEELLRSDEVLQCPEIQEMNKKRRRKKSDQINQDFLMVKIAM